MGADGGVCWMRLRDPARYQRLCDLVRPFWWLTDSGEADWQAEASDSWLSANPLYSAPAYIVGRYGTSQDWDLTDLADMLRGEDADLCSDPALTFAELIEDIDTRPGHYAHRSLSGEAPMLERWVLEVRWLYGRAGLGVLEGMTVEQWAAEMRRILIAGSVGSEETWT